MLLASFALFAGANEDEFIFWAELSSKDLILTHQSQNLSMAMTKSPKNTRQIYACELFYTDDERENLPKTALGVIDNEMPKERKFKFLQDHEKELVECFAVANVSVRGKTSTELLKAKSEVYMKMLPLRFTIDFGTNSALIYQLLKP